MLQKAASPPRSYWECGILFEILPASWSQSFQLCIEYDSSLLSLMDWLMSGSSDYTCELVSILFYLSIWKTFVSLYQQRWCSKWGLQVVTSILYQPGCRRRLSLCWLTSLLFWKPQLRVFSSCLQTDHGGTSSENPQLGRTVFSNFRIAFKFRKDFKPFFKHLVWEIHVARGQLYSRLLFDIISQFCWPSQQPLTQSAGPRVPPGWWCLHLPVVKILTTQQNFPVLSLPT